MYTDIHSHILPGVDDGPKTLEEAVALIKLSALEGITNIIATPHFYASRHDLDERLLLINKQFELVKDSFKTDFSNLNFHLGMEVRYFNDISKSDSLEKLCIQNSKVLLLELGYEPINEKIISELIELYYRGFTVILAHIERYYKVKGFSNLKNLIKEGFVKAQLTASSIFDSPFARISAKLLKSGYISYIASDMHSVDLRPPKLKQAFEYIEKKYGTIEKNVLVNNSFSLFESIEI